MVAFPFPPPVGVFELPLPCFGVWPHDVREKRKRLLMVTGGRSRHAISEHFGRSVRLSCRWVLYPRRLPSPPSVPSSLLCPLSPSPSPPFFLHTPQQVEHLSLTRNDTQPPSALLTTIDYVLYTVSLDLCGQASSPSRSADVMHEMTGSPG